MAHASHELRTPITVERTLLQVALADADATVDALRPACERVLASGRQAERLIESLLTLASSERGLDRHEPVDLAAIAADVIIECLVTNLVSNALQYNTAPGWVTIETGTQAGSATLAVSNPGPAVPASQIARLFQPFQRLDGQRTRRSKHGLGLAIVRAIAAARGADIHASPSQAGGLDIQLRFTPAALPAANGNPGAASSAARKAPPHREN